jgi:hypothetical protein
MAEIGRDPAGFEFAMQISTGTSRESRRDGLRLALDGAEAGATSLVLSMPPALGAEGIDLVARELAAPLRDALG